MDDDDECEGEHADSTGDGEHEAEQHGYCHSYFNDHLVCQLNATIKFHFHLHQVELTSD
jgi:hypothetical protein